MIITTDKNNLKNSISINDKKLIKNHFNYLKKKEFPQEHCEKPTVTSNLVTYKKNFMP